MMSLISTLTWRNKIQALFSETRVGSLLRLADLLFWHLQHSKKKKKGGGQ